MINQEITHNIVSNDISVCAAYHPFSVNRIDKIISVGMNIDQIISDVQPDVILRKYAHVSINGHYIEQNNWRNIYPKSGSLINIRMVPMGGGGGKNPLRSILTLAVALAAPQLAGAFAGSAFNIFGQSVLGFRTASFIGGTINLVSKLAINALAPPSKPRFSSLSAESPTLFLQGAQNSIQPFGKIPRVLGRHRMIPPLAAKPFTETVGNDQYIRMLFIWGYGPLEVTDLRIGETPISEFSDVEMEHRTGRVDDAALSLFSNSVIQNNLQIKLNQSDGFVTRTTEKDVDEISVDITFPRGVVKFNSNGGKTARTVHLEIQYAPIGTSDWSVGVQGYKSISSQNTQSLNVPGIKSLRVGGSTYRYNKRLDYVVLDKASGRVSVVVGETQRGFDVNGETILKRTVEPVLPPVPDNKLKLAKLTHVGDNLFHEIEDLRQTFIDEGIFQTANDFALTISNSHLVISSGGLQFNGIEIKAKQSAALRRSVRFTVPVGQYDVRVRRVTGDNASDDTIFDDALWTALRTIRYEEPVKLKGLALTALRIKATDQLNGVVDKLNGIVQSVLPDWDGTSWVEQATSNPASIYREILQGAANARPLPDDRLNLSALQQWHENCDDNDREFNAVIDFQGSVYDVLSDVASTGRASPSVVDGKWSVVQDFKQPIPVQHFTPRNSFGFSSDKNFDDIPHGFRVRFINRYNGWLQDEMLVFDEGYDEINATKFEGLELSGVTDPDQVWKDARYHIATAVLRPELYSFHADIEHIVCTRGDLIRFSHDVPLFGLMSGRVKSVISDNGTPEKVISVELDADIRMEAGKFYSMRFRLSDGTSVIQSIITQPGQVNVVLFSVPFDINLAPSTGDLFMFGESNSESVELIVKSIEPQENMKARITCVDAAPAIHDIDQGTTPEFDSQITVPVILQQPPAPKIIDVQSDEKVFIRNADGSILSRIVIYLDKEDVEFDLKLQVLIKAQDEDSFHPADIRSQDNRSVSITNIEEGEIYTLELRYIGASSLLSEPAFISNYKVEGTTNEPSDVIDFNINVLNNTAYLTWSAVADVDISHYEIRHTSDIANVTWGSSVEILSKISSGMTSISLPLLTGSFLIKAVDFGGRKSVNENIIISNINEISSLNFVAQIDQSPDFLGDKENTYVSNNKLHLLGVDVIEDWLNTDLVLNTDIGDSGVAISGIYDFADVFDLAGVYTSILTASINAVGVDLIKNIDAYSVIDQVESWDNSIDNSYWSVGLQVSITDDDPNISPIWSSWREFVVGEYTARAFKFRAVLNSQEGSITPMISDLSVKIDMPDRVISADNIASNTAGSQINFANGLKEIPAIAISAQNMSTGDYYQITNINTDGFFIQFFDNADVGISRSFDYIAKGFGYKN